jgi:hypothetical protein
MEGYLLYHRKPGIAKAFVLQGGYEVCEVTDVRGTEIATFS